MTAQTAPHLSLTAPPAVAQKTTTGTKHPYATLTLNAYLIKHTHMCLSFRPQHAWNVPQWEHPIPSSHEEVSLLVLDATKTT